MRDEIPELWPRPPSAESGRHLVPGTAPDRLRRQHRCAKRSRRCSATVKPQLMVTDPPYGVNTIRPGGTAPASTSPRAPARSETTSEPTGRRPGRCFPGNIAYVWHGALHATTVAESLVREGFAIRAQIIWAKERLVIGRGDYHWQHEPCWYAVRNKGNWTGDRKQTTLWTIPSGGQDAETVHGTQKPVECMRRPMLQQQQCRARPSTSRSSAAARR